MFISSFDNKILLVVGYPSLQTCCFDVGAKFLRMLIPIIHSIKHVRGL